MLDIVKVCRQHDFHSENFSRCCSVGSLPLNLTELEQTLCLHGSQVAHLEWVVSVRPEARESLQPTFIGWRSIVTDSQGKPVGWQSDGRRYEVATSAPVLRLRSLLISNGEALRNATSRFLSYYLWQRLTELTDILLCYGLPHQKRGLSLSTNQ